MPSNHKERFLGSEQIVKLMRTYLYKNRELADDQKMSIAEIADAIKKSESVTEAYKQLGLTYKDIKKVSSLGALK